MRTKKKLTVGIPLQLSKEKYHGSLRSYFEEEARHNDANPLFNDLYRSVYDIGVEGADWVGDPAHPPVLVVYFDEAERPLADIQNVLLKLGVTTSLAE